MQALLASRDDAISQLMAKVKLQAAELAVSPKASRSKSQPMVKIQLREAVTPPNSSVKSSRSKPALLKARPLPSPSNKKLNWSSSDGNRKSAAPPKSNQSTPCQPKRNITPKTDSPKVNPLQMISRDMPKSLSLTRQSSRCEADEINHASTLIQAEGLASAGFNHGDNKRSEDLKRRALERGG
ncbi:hypothetical protein H4Q26_007683 [Puccinia striiformis f. sp. tritici PST-130]|nr:hypothetical protein H4Q26_007683 [Puccinia striiformis f. sp. tritici PST-130]